MVDIETQLQRRGDLLKPRDGARGRRSGAESLGDRGRRAHVCCKRQSAATGERRPDMNRGSDMERTHFAARSSGFWCCRKLSEFEVEREFPGFAD